MLYRTFAALLIVTSVFSVQARSEDLHETWLKYFTGKWTWKSSNGNHGTVVFERFSNSCGQVVKERCENLDKSAVMTHGWRSDIKAFGGTGYDSDGNYVETFFPEITETTLKGHRIRRSETEETKELWELTRKSKDIYELNVTIDGEKSKIVVTRQ